VGGTPGFHPGAFSAVPAGLGRFSNLYPGLRPGLLSAVPTGLDLARLVLTGSLARTLTRKTHWPSGPEVRLYMHLQKFKEICTSVPELSYVRA
jgi:hypothetical protein